MKRHARVIAFPTTAARRLATPFGANGAVVVRDAATPDERLHAMALGNKMQILALVSPRRLREVEKLVDRLLTA